MLTTGSLSTIFVLVPFILGLAVHELSHRFLGSFFGGNTRLSSGKFPIPTSTKFDTPQAMSDLGVRLSAGFTPVVGTVLLAWCIRKGLLFPGFFALGLALWSFNDIFAFCRPGPWKKATAGESLNPEDFE